jgi:phosphate/sulfate permease
MNLSIVTVALISAFVAYTNGANDVSKGIATLAGSGVSSYRRAILWGAFWTTCGGIAAFGLSRALVTTFGKGLLSGIQKGGAVDWKPVREMVLAWVVTLPAGALLGVLAYGLLRSVFGMHRCDH